MDKNEDVSTRSEPPKTESEWRHFWLGVERAHKSWLIVAPIWAVVTNWRAILVIFGIIAFIRGEELIAAVRAFLGVGA